MRMRSLVATFAVSVLATGGLATAGLTAATAAPPSDDPSSIVSTQHNPGQLQVQEKIPDDQKMPDGSPHPCAGRYLIYRAHTDPVYLTRYDGKATMMVIAGSSVVPADKVCLRLGRDSSGGHETSRFVVPDSPSYAFLGKPGRILWYAPLARPANASPVWAGIGAFDPTHERQQPPDTTAGTQANLTLTDFRGPGRMNIFINSLGQAPRQLISSVDPNYKTVETPIGGHSHASTTFTKPGIYHTFWQGSYVTTKGVPEVSEPQDVIWLVGSNEDAGLPSDFPRTFEEPTTTAEDQRAAMGLTDPHDDSDGLTGATSQSRDVPPPDLSESAGDGIDSHYRGDWAVKPEGVMRTRSTITVVGTDDTDFLGAKGAGDKEALYEVHNDTKSGALSCPAEGTIPSEVERGLSGGWLWSTGKDGHPAVSLDLTTLRDLDATKPVTVIPELSAIGSKGVAAAGQWRDGHFEARVRSDGGGYGNYRVEDPTQPQTFDLVFSDQGYYTLGFTVAYTSKSGESLGPTITVHFIVGNSAINYLEDDFETGVEHNADLERFGTCENPVAIRDDDSDGGDHSGSTGGSTEKPEPSPTPDLTPKPTDPTPAPNPTTTPAPAPTTDPHPQPVASVDPGECSVRAAWEGHIPTQQITHGHQDVGLNENGVAEVNNTADPAHPLHQASGDFAFIVPSKTLSLPSNVLPTDIAPDFSGKAYYIPMTQEDDRPWAGFSTQNYLASKVRDGVDLTLRTIAAPEGSRFVMGQYSDFSGWETILDSKNPSLVRHYADPVHEHPYTLMNMQGIYVMEFTFSWNDAASGEARATTLRATYVVGDEGKALYDAISASPQTPAGCSVPTPPSAGTPEPEAPDSSTAPTGKPAPSTAPTEKPDPSTAPTEKHDPSTAPGETPAPSTGTPGSSPTESDSRPPAGDGNTDATRPGSTTPPSGGSPSPARTPHAGAILPKSSTPTVTLDRLITPALIEASSHTEARAPEAGASSAGTAPTESASTGAGAAPVLVPRAPSAVSAAPGTSSGGSAGAADTSDSTSNSSASVTGSVQGPVDDSAQAPSGTMQPSVSAAGDSGSESSTSPLVWILLGAGGTAGVFGVAALIAALIIARRTRL